MMHYHEEHVGMQGSLPDMGIFVQQTLKSRFSHCWLHNNIRKKTLSNHFLKVLSAAQRVAYGGGMCL